jgi:RNA polymerase sigma factor (sigma-70 family)
MRHIRCSATLPNHESQWKRKPDMTECLHEISDENLIQMVAANDAMAFEEIDRRWRKLLVGFIAIKVKNVTDAEDLAQTVLVKAWERSGTFNVKSGTFKSWIKQMAANAIVDHIRRAGRKKRGGELVRAEIVEETLQQPEHGELDYDVEYLRSLVESLPVRERRVVRAIMNESSIAEMVDKTELTRAAVVKLRTAALERMRHSVCERESGTGTIATVPQQQTRQVQQTLF